MHWPDARDRMAWEAREKDRWLDEMAKRTTPRDASGRKLSAINRRAFWAKYVDRGGELWLDADQMVSHGVVDELWTASS